MKNLRNLSKEIGVDVKDLLKADTNWICRLLEISRCYKEALQAKRTMMEAIEAAKRRT